MSLGFECCILSQEDFIHTTLADLLNDSVMANGLADHWCSPSRNAVAPNATPGGG